MNITHERLPGALLNIGATTKFKTVRIQIAFQRPIDEDEVTARAVLPYVMRAVSNRYPTRSALQIKLEELYSASFYGTVRKIGRTHEVSFDLHLIQNDYAADVPDLLEEGFRFLADILFSPSFDPDVFEEEVRLIDEYFLGLFGDKMRYSLRKLEETMYAGDPYRLSAMGLHERLSDVTLADIEQAYRSMMAEDVIHINVVGAVDPAHLRTLVERHLPFVPRPIVRDVIDLHHRTIDAPRVVVETQDVSQGKLTIGYQLPVHYLTKDYYAAVVFNMLVGGSSDSLLFQRIREELNQVYFIGSSYDQYKGSMVIYAGIDSSARDLVEQEIKTILAGLAQGSVPPTPLSIAKTALIQGMLESLDSIRSVTGRIHHLAMFDRTFDADQLIAAIEAVTTADIARIAGMVQHDTTFFLRGETL
jgi:predicted Zn-dependent peptidase